MGISHVSKAHDEMFCSPKIMAIRTCSKYEQMFLRSIVYCFEKSGLEETSFARVFDTLTEQLMLEGMIFKPLENILQKDEITTLHKASFILENRCPSNSVPNYNIQSSDSGFHKIPEVYQFCKRAAHA